jgi:tRNA(Ile)-lysidine synthase
MADYSPAVDRVRDAVGESLRGAGDGKLVLAVSGGRDSMVMLDVFARSFPDRVACVATFDHGSGADATAAAEQVERRALALGIPVERGRAEGVVALRREAAWREARWKFLHEVSCEAGAAVATAHTRDDQVETVLMRALRGSAARGLAGLYARSDVVRPLLALTRGEVARYAAELDVRWLEDPSNVSRAHQRTRIRLDLLPALERSAAGLSETLLELSRRASRLRDEVDQLISESVSSKAIRFTARPSRRGSFVVTLTFVKDSRLVEEIWRGCAVAHAGNPHYFVIGQHHRPTAPPFCVYTSVAEEPLHSPRHGGAEWDHPVSGAPGSHHDLDIGG